LDDEVGILDGERVVFSPLLQIVLKCLTSDHTLQSILIHAGVFHEPDIVPVHFPAKAFKVYIGALFLAETMPFENIDLWLDRIFMPIALYLKHRRGGVGDYWENRAELVAAGIKFQKQ
jgi:hypothetical protein